MPTSHEERAVLFVDICDSTRLYETLGDDVAARCVSACLQALSKLVTLPSGRVIQRRGDELMCLFDSADAAIDTACEMQEWTLRQGGRGLSEISLRIGCHFGPVLEAGEDIFGDSVNLAARAAAMAKATQVITTAATVERLCGRLRERVRRLGNFTVKGKSEDVTIWELMWQQTDDATQIGTHPGAQAVVMRPARLVLRYLDDELVLDRQHRQTVMLGRDASCDVVIKDPRASRRHARIERRLGKFVLVDQSVNGTYVHINEESVLLRREELILYARGSIGFGYRLDSVHAPVVQFVCE
jgi:adenylate cyclase